LAFNTNKFISPLFKLFGKKLAGVPPSPSNLDIIQFNSTSNEWELSQGIIGNAVQSSSNVGTGAGLALSRVLDDLPFKSLVDGVEIVITVTATELIFSIGTIAISKISGLQVALDTKIETITNVGGASEIAQAKVGQNVNLRTLLANLEILITTNANDLAFSIGAIAQSKITGLVALLATKIDTIVNVGTGVGKVFRDKVGTTMNLKSIKAGTGISVVNNADDIEIIATGGGGVDVKGGSDTVVVNSTTAIVFNTAFVGTPNVVVSFAGNVDFVDNEKAIALSVFNISTTGFTVRYDEKDGNSPSPASFEWLATDAGDP